MVVVLYTMAFVLGPALFLLLARRGGRRWPLALIASLLVVLSLTFRSEARLTPTLDPVPLFLSVVLIWLAWIVVLAVVMRAVQAASPSRAVHRASRAILAMGTTVPWFGFATARMMATP